MGNESTFTSQLAQWADGLPHEIVAATIETAEQVLQLVKLNTPVRTGHLRSKWHLVENRDGSYSIQNDTPYGAIVNYGTRKSRGAHMMEKAIIELENQHSV